MRDATEFGEVAPLSSEFAAVDFGDARLGLRLWRIVEAIAEKPAASFPEAMCDDADLEGFYRFVNNPRVTPTKILAPHIEETCGRSAQAKTVLAIHDTTSVQYQGEAPREGLGRVAGNKQGYFAHTAIAVTADGFRKPLGLLGLQTFHRSWQRRGTQETKTRSKRFQAPDSEALRWSELVDEVDALAQGRFTAIHVMDREGDAFGLLGHMVTRGMSFVVRSTHDREVIPEDGRVQRLSEALTQALPVVEREVHISRRPKKGPPGAQRKHPPREARLARLQISATKVTVVATAFAGRLAPKTLSLNCVHVREVDAPDGVEPVEWRLWTQLPVDTPDQILYVVDVYRARWTIEEFFKALKTGCSLEKRQQDNGESLANVLALLIPVAWRLLLLRYAARHSPEAPASSVLTTTQLEILAALRSTRWPAMPSARDALLAVAAMGGHIKNNGEPGWMVLGRGYEDLLRLEIGWSLRAQKM